MNNVILKFVLPKDHRAEILMPKNAEILTLQIAENTGGPCIWALCDEEAVFEARMFITLGTGWGLNKVEFEGLTYIGTYQQVGFVWHVFEKKYE